MGRSCGVNREITAAVTSLWVCVFVCKLTGIEVAVAVGLPVSLLIVGHGRHLLG